MLDPRALPALRSFGVLLALTLAPRAAQERGAWEQNVVRGPGPVEADLFHPDRDRAVQPVRGGTVRVHLSALPRNINYMVENSAVTRRIQREIHEYLLEEGWEDWQPHAVLARDLPVVEDTLIRREGRGADGAEVLYGDVVEADDVFVVTPRSKGNPLSEPARVAKDAVERVERGTVFTFELKPGVRWHDGHELDAHDVAFSLRCYWNPTVDCDSTRFKFEKFADVEVVDDLTVRFFYREQYFRALKTFYELTIVPAHLYDLSDPDNPAHDPHATAEQQGTFVNDHPANRLWIGLGPYRVTSFGDDGVVARRVDTYDVTAQNGYVDQIVWKHIPSDDAAKTALINGQLDFWDRLRSEDFFGQYTKQAAFTDSFYKGYVSLPYIGYSTWNMRRPHLSDPLVRRALNMCFDWEAAIDELYYGLASRVTGTQFYFGPDYDHSIEPVPFDLDAAEDLLLEAGWYDRDGDDVIDKDGVPLQVEFLMPTGNKASELLANQLQENLAKIGVKMTIARREWAQFMERLDERDYDFANLAWILTLESDPEQLWHSKWTDGRSSNHSGMADEEVDRLIEAIQRELDGGPRSELFSQLQQRIYELQPYMFGVTQPKKIAVSHRIRNLKAYAPDPNYRIREWFVVDGASSGAAGQ